MSADTAITEAKLRELLSQFADAVHERISELEGQVLNLSQALAEKEHGTEAVRAACKWAGPKLGEFAREHHPYDALVQTFKGNTH